MTLDTQCQPCENGTHRACKWADGIEATCCCGALLDDEEAT